MYALHLGVLFYFLSQSSADLTTTSAMLSPKYMIREKGYCLWYGQCGINPATKKPINCLYNGKAKPIDTAESGDILRHLCPELVQDNRGVCCDEKQLVSLQSGLQSAEQMMSRCPACWKNFRQLYCQMTCSPDNSLFINVTGIIPEEHAITSIAYYVDPAFRDGLYNSCKDVSFPSINKKIMDFMCGTTVDKCNPLRFLRFMGDPELNDVSPFKISYPVDTTGHGGIEAMNVTIKLCNEKFHEPYTNKTSYACSCQDCLKSCGMYPPGRWEFDIGDSGFHIIQIIFSIKPESKFYNKETCYNTFVHPDCMLTGPIFRKQFLFKVLELQTHLMNMSIPFHDGNSFSRVALKDICLKSLHGLNDNCVVTSVLQYWQNDVKKLNKCIGALFDCSQGFIKASWGDHLLACANNPVAANDTTPLGLPCLSLYGGPVEPTTVLGGYMNNNFTDAKNLAVIFALKNHQNGYNNIDMVKVWEKALFDQLKAYHDEDLQVIFQSKKIYSALFAD